MRRLALLALAALALAPSAQAEPPDPMEIHQPAAPEKVPIATAALEAPEVASAVLELDAGVHDLISVAVQVHEDAVARLEVEPACELAQGLVLIEPDGVEVPSPDQSSPPAPDPDRLNEPDRLTLRGDPIHPATPAGEVRAPTRPAA